MISSLNGDSRRLNSCYAIKFGDQGTIGVVELEFGDKISWVFLHTVALHFVN